MEPSPVDSLKQRLIESGPMSVGDFMGWCLTGSATAYYRNGNPLGAAGDFVTAPEVSQIFGELVAVWACSVWQSMGEPRPFVLAELGPGRGTLMQDAMRAARVMPGFLEAAQLHLVETSETLRREQGQLLSDFHPQWHETVSAVPGKEYRRSRVWDGFVDGYSVFPLSLSSY
jgi:SAM-dependent MidA family methyltransferase